MKEVRLHEGELHVMELLWANKILAAKDITKILKEHIGWEKNTTYTVIKRLIEKGVIVREEPGFLCQAAISKKVIQTTQTNALIKNLYCNSLRNFIEEYLRYQPLSKDMITDLEKIIKEQKTLL